jgi:hypothetical protein
MRTRYTSLYGQMAYVILSGLALLLVPNLLLGLFGFPTTTEPWIRIMGTLVLTLSFYYYAMARHGTPMIVWATVRGRLFFCFGLVLFVVFGLAKTPLLGFAAAETLLSLWTWRELR